MSRNKYAVARRSIWYILRILLTLVAVITLTLGVFITGLYTSNIYIILHDGMSKRANCILNESDFSELTEYFTDDFLLTDEALQKDAYAGFTVSSYDYRVEVEKLLALPWESAVDVRVIDKLAAISAEPVEQAADGGLPPSLPEWQAKRCDIQFVRRDGKWLINKITVLETNPMEKPLPTPDMSLAQNAA